MHSEYIFSRWTKNLNRKLDGFQGTVRILRFKTLISYSELFGLKRSVPKEGVGDSEKRRSSPHPVIFPKYSHTWDASQSSLSMASSRSLAGVTFWKRPALGSGNVSLCSSSCSWPCSSCILLCSSRSSHCSTCSWPTSFWLAWYCSCSPVSLDSRVSHCGVGGRVWTVVGYAEALLSAVCALLPLVARQGLPPRSVPRD